MLILKDNNNNSFTINFLEKHYRKTIEFITQDDIETLFKTLINCKNCENSFWCTLCNNCNGLMLCNNCNDCEDCCFSDDLNNKKRYYMNSPQDPFEAFR